MGSKGSSTPSQPMMQQDNTAAMMEQYMGMMSEMFAQQQEQMNTLMTSMQQTDEAPEVIANPEVDWTEKNAELQAKMAADYDGTVAQQVNGASTVLTSPLLDEEEPTTQTSVLGSANA